MEKEDPFVCFVLTCTLEIRKVMARIERHGVLIDSQYNDTLHDTAKAFELIASEYHWPSLTFRKRLIKSHPYVFQINCIFKASAGPYITLGKEFTK